jgi:hypothetical protein
MTPSVDIICHLFYPQLAELLLGKLCYFNSKQTHYFINVQGNSKQHQQLIETAKTFDNCCLLTTPHKGRDIGAKLTLINLALLLNSSSEYTLIIHDKKSAYTPGGDRWRDELFKIISPAIADKVFQIFEKNSDVGIVGAANYIQDEYDEKSGEFLTMNKRQLKEILHKYGIEVKDYRFVAGNIFWIRTRLLADFFLGKPIPAIKSELEDGNKLDVENGTFIHAWERIMSWIPAAGGLRIYGI